MKATLPQLATYIERDRATVQVNADGSQTVTAPLAGAGHVSWVVPAHLVDDLNRERDLAYRQARDRQRQAAGLQGPQGAQERPRRDDARCRRCSHTWAWHRRTLAAGGHQTDAGWCSCAAFVSRGRP